MYTTQNLWNAGWYKGGPVPGAPGDAVIEGHAGYPNAPLLFGRYSPSRYGRTVWAAEPHADHVHRAV
jgi:hypothetical protein